MEPEEYADATVAEIGEAALLRLILGRVGSGPMTILGPGDDAAVLETPSGAVVATTDTLIDGPDFRRAWMSGHDLGWKSAAVNLADIAAMGASPTGFLVALALPPATPVRYVLDFADGVRAACESLAPGCGVIGGDLATSSVLTVAITALGDLGPRPAVTRSGAKSGDAIALAGEMGRAAAGLDLLFSRFADADGVAFAVDEDAITPDEVRLIDAQRRPSPPIGLGPLAAAAGATAMMDVSDGLAIDASRIADASAVTLDFAAAALGADPLAALAGGEDHALLATFPQGVVPSGFRVIGQVRDRAAHAVTLDGSAVPRSGWDPYAA